MRCTPSHDNGKLSACSSTTHDGIRSAATKEEESIEERIPVEVTEIVLIDGGEGLENQGCDVMDIEPTGDGKGLKHHGCDMTEVDLKET